MADMLFQTLWEQKAFAKLAQDAKNGGLAVTGVTESQKAHLLAALLQQSQDESPPLLVVTYNEQQAARLQEDLEFLLSEPVALLPARQVNYYRTAIHTREVEGQRVGVLGGLLSGRNRVLVASAEALLFRLCPMPVFSGSILRLSEGQTIGLTSLTRQLSAAGFERVDSVQARGEFCVRGGILDVAPLDDEFAYRIEFWDDDIDAIRRFDVSTQRSVDRVRTLILRPATETVAGPEEAERAVALLTKERDRLRKAGVSRREPDSQEEEFIPRAFLGQDAPQRQLQRVEAALEALMPLMEGETGYVEGLDALLPLLYEKTATILDYFPDQKPLICLDEPARLRERCDNVELEWAEQMKGLLEQGEIISAQIEQCIKWDALLATFQPHTLLTFHMLNRGTTEVRPRALCNLQVRGVPAFHGQLDPLSSELHTWARKGYRVILLSGTRSRGQRLASELQSRGHSAFFTPTRDLPLLPGQVAVLPGGLTTGGVASSGLAHGFEYAEWKLAVVSDQEIFGVQKKAARTGKKRSGRKLDAFTDLRVGDLVVHEHHGIGRYEGIIKLTVEGKSRDYLHIRYSGADTLYVPTDQMDLVQRYIGMEEKSPRLAKLGGNEWNKTKNKVRESIREMAEDLIKLYAARQARKGFAFNEDTPWQRDFEDRFPYEETPDQLTCIEDVKRDMESPRIMDRLVCGDVGYGKTEVAIRAAFKAVLDGKQVAFLVPTTILAQQHYTNLSQRFADFPVKVEMLSRFRTPAEQKRIIERMRDGNLDIIVGTHRLLNKDIQWRDLGLLVVDEEQRFGVTHKEAIKAMRNNVDVLTLSATPIPRTLHMSLVGIRDMSLIESPPEERYPVQTYVMEYNEGIVRDAILRELARGGQVYYVYNRVRSIDRIAGALQRLVPEARIGVGHGQLSETALEDVMVDFYGHEYDVLVCSTIIENGLDVPNANTIIIHDSEFFGLSQMYQMRGRVGRSNRLAYAYLLFRPGKVMSEVAEKRLLAIREFNELGAGFKVAMRDLEIRGAGNLLGAQQHGHLSSVGYDLYCKLMEDTIRHMKGELLEDEETEPTLEIRIDAYLPQEYVRDEGQKVEMYKRIAAIRTREQRDDVEEELEDRFGNLSEPVRNLLAVAYLKALAASFRVATVSEQPGKLILRFEDAARIEPQVLLPLLEKYAKNIMLAATQPPRLTWQEKDAPLEQLLKSVTGFLEEWQKQVTKL